LRELALDEVEIVEDRGEIISGRVCCLARVIEARSLHHR
jgi:hypothetical protein